MADDIRLVARLEADVRKLEKEIGRARQTTDKQLTAIQKKFNETNKVVSTLGGGIGGTQGFKALQGQLAALAGAAGLSALAQFVSRVGEIAEQADKIGITTSADSARHRAEWRHGRAGGERAREVLQEHRRRPAGRR